MAAIPGKHQRVVPHTSTVGDLFAQHREIAETYTAAKSNDVLFDKACGTKRLQRRVVIRKDVRRNWQGPNIVNIFRLILNPESVEIVAQVLEIGINHAKSIWAIVRIVMVDLPQWLIVKIISAVIKMINCKSAIPDDPPHSAVGDVLLWCSN